MTRLRIGSKRTRRLDRLSPKYGRFVPSQWAAGLRASGNWQIAQRVADVQSTAGEASQLVDANLQFDHTHLGGVQIDQQLLRAL